MLIYRILGGGIGRIVDFHNGGLIATAVAIIGRRKDGHNRPIVLPLIALHNELMGSRNEIQAIDVRELLRNVLPKGIARAPWRYAPAASDVL